MKNLRQLLCAGLLVSALTVNASAGYMITGVTSQPTPAPSPATASTGDNTGAEPTTAGTGSEAQAPSVTEMTLSLIQTVLALL